MVTLTKVSVIKFLASIFFITIYWYLVLLILKINLFSKIFDGSLVSYFYSFLLDLYLVYGKYNLTGKYWNKQYVKKSLLCFLFLSIFLIIAPWIQFAYNPNIGEKFMFFGLEITLILMNTYISYRYIILPKINTTCS